MSFGCPHGREPMLVRKLRRLQQHLIFATWLFRRVSAEEEQAKLRCHSISLLTSGALKIIHPSFHELAVDLVVFSTCADGCFRCVAADFSEHNKQAWPAQS